MLEIFSPFNSKQKRRQILICVLIFIGMAIPFKVMVLIEGLTEVRPVNAVPVVAGLLLGPAGAWGCAIGNLIADFFGTLTKGSILGFVGNFIAAYLPYKIWHISDRREKPNLKSTLNIIRYVLITAITAIATAILIACGLDVFLGTWIPQLFWIIVLNNLGFPLFLGLPVLIVLTSEESKLAITLPEGTAVSEGITRSALQRKRSLKVKYGLLLTLLASEVALLLTIYLGIQMSASPLMAIIGVIFLITLLGFMSITETKDSDKMS